MSRTPCMAGNWKMHKDHLEAIQFVQQLVYNLKPNDYDNGEIVVIPTFTALRSIQTLIEGDRLEVGLGAQNCHWEDAGAYTGEVSPPMLARLNVKYVVCGHSERRQLFHESDEDVNRKVHAVFNHGMIPILCVGETDEQRESGEAENVVIGQLRACLDGVDAEQAASMIVAYEPIWAIGTGQTATPADANEMCGIVRRVVGERYDDQTAQSLRIQYGGSVKPGNVVEIMDQPDIDGALVGSASLDPEDFAAVCGYHRL
ncbi:MAG: triose-phosphate isomerase [Actinomycetota bacterium]|nr:triose-phosphate isomerase [Actinomycetota bacterium]